MRDYIQFILDGEVVIEHHLDPTMSVLEYLRERRMRTGTKEGCAEGDCGACTVVVSELINGKIQTRAVNACILFVPTLDGKELQTIESIGTPDTPHQIQKLVAEKHGSQCGFCTPGIVMSLYGLQAAGLELTKQNIEQSLAGNLCRCTGYGPILEAAKTMPLTSETPDTKLLESLNHDDLIKFQARVRGQDKTFYIPKTLEQLAKLKAENPDAVLLAGGTDIGLWVTKHHMELSQIIYLGEVSALNDIEETDDALIIGAGVKYTDTCEKLGAEFPHMETVMRRIGATQIRNLGTIGGNIANGSPIGDMPPMLIAANAQLVLQSTSGSREISLEDYFIDYGKQDLQAGAFVKSVIVPKRETNQVYFTDKISKRFESDISAVCLGLSLTLSGGVCSNVRIAYGGMAATPKRAKNAETALEGKSWNETNVRKAMAALADDFTPIDDMRASKFYRMQVAKNLILKAWHSQTSDTPTHVLEANT